MIPERYKIGKIAISRTNLHNVLKVIDNALVKKSLGYICVTNSRTSFLANKNAEYCNIQNSSLLTVPDGAPLIWYARNSGYVDVGKCSGKDLMEKLIEISIAKGYSHYFYGCSQDTIDKMLKTLVEKYDGIQIKAAVSPPFQPIEKFDIEELAQEINSLSPTFFWCGLGAPKQERLMALLQPKLDKTICIGVGLAFEYFAGTVIRVPKPIERMGLEWLFRCMQQPIKARRFIVPFMWMSVQLVKSKIFKK